MLRVDREHDGGLGVITHAARASARSGREAKAGPAQLTTTSVFHWAKEESGRLAGTAAPFRTKRGTVTRHKAGAGVANKARPSVSGRRQRAILTSKDRDCSFQAPQPPR